MADLSLAPNPWFTGFDDLGIIVPGGKLFTYAAGTSNKLATYTDVAGTVANTNPIILDAAGRVPSGFYLLPASYKFVFAPATDTDPPTNPIRTQDNIKATASFSVSPAEQGVAGENLALNDSVYESQGDGGRTAGRWYKTDADFAYASSLAVKLGWASAPLLSGITGQIQLGGKVTTQGLVVPGTVYYASATAGAITATPPINRRVVGVADSSSTLLLDQAQPWTATAQPLTIANTPAVGVGGALIRRTDGSRGLFMDSGGQWVAINGGVANVRDFGATGDGTTNDAAAINAALATGLHVYLPQGDYNLGTTSLVPFGSQTISGDGIGTNATFRTRLLYSGNGSAILDTHAINSSGYALITIEDLYIFGSGAASTGAGIELLAGGFSYYTIRRCRIGGTFKYGIIADGIEVSQIEENIIENNTFVGTSVGLWIVNGDNRRASQALGFSNVISVTKNQFNGQTYGIIDDGGNSHNILGNNLNGNSVALAVAGLTDAIIAQNNIENAGIITGIANILFSDRCVLGGGSINVDKLPCKGVQVTNNGLRGDMVSGTSALVKFTATTALAFHTGITASGNLCGNQLGRSGAFDVTRLGRSFVAHNVDEAATAHFIGTHNSTATADPQANTLMVPSGTSDSVANAFATLMPCLMGLRVWTPTAALADNAVSTNSQTVLGAVVGDMAIASINTVAPGAAIFMTANVTAADTVTITLLNKTGGPLTLGSSISKIFVFKPVL